MFLVYEFWARDAATEVAKEVLEELRISYKVKTGRMVRDPSAPEDCRHDEWAEIYVGFNDLVKWLQERIEREIETR